MIAARWAMRLIGLVSTVILARILMPEDFGIIAMAMIVVGLLETIAYAGADLALMREGASTREHYDTAWTIQVIQGGFVAGVLLLIAPFAAKYFSEPRATAVIQLVALRCLLGGFQNIGVVAFRKELDFAKEFRFTVYSKLLNFFVLVGAALWFRNYWAIALAMTTGSIIAVALSFVMHPYRPRFCLTRIDEIWSFSQWLMISRIGSFLNTRSDSFLVGGILGTSAMGSYHVASEVASMAPQELVMPVRRALYPTLARLESQESAFSAGVVSSFSTIAALCIAVGVGLMTVAPELVRLFLGSKWIDAIPLVQLLALHSSASALVLVLEVSLWVKGKTKASAMQAWLEVLILIPLLWSMTHLYQANGAAGARAGVGIVMVPVMMLMVARMGCVTVAQLGAELWRPLLAAGAMALLVINIDLGDLALVWGLLIKTGAGALSYGCAMLLLWIVVGRPEGIEAQSIRRVKSIIASARSFS